MRNPFHSPRCRQESSFLRGSAARRLIRRGNVFSAHCRNGLLPRGLPASQSFRGEREGFGEGRGAFSKRLPSPPQSFSNSRRGGFPRPCRGWGRRPFQGRRGPDGEHEHLEIESHLGAPVIDGASLAVQGNSVGPAAALLPLAGHDGINMLAGFRGIKLLTC